MRGFSLASFFFLFSLLFTGCFSGNYSVNSTDEGKQLVELDDFSLELFGDYRVTSQKRKIFPPLGNYLDPILPPKRKHLFYSSTIIEPFIGLVVSKDCKSITEKRSPDILIREEKLTLDHPHFESGIYFLYTNEFYDVQTGVVEYRFATEEFDISLIFWSYQRQESLLSEAERIAATVSLNP